MPRIMNEIGKKNPCSHGADILLGEGKHVHILFGEK